MLIQFLNLGCLDSVVNILTNSSTELFIVSAEYAQEALEAFVADTIARALVMIGDFDSVQDAMEEAKSRFVVVHVQEASEEMAKKLAGLGYWRFFVDDADFVAHYEVEMKKAQEFYDQHGWTWEVDGRNSRYTIVLSDYVGSWFVFGTYDNSIPGLAFDELERIADRRVHLG